MYVDGFRIRTHEQSYSREDGKGHREMSVYTFERQGASSDI